jgi:hypothetical protein
MFIGLPEDDDSVPFMFKYGTTSKSCWRSSKEQAGQQAHVSRNRVKSASTTCFINEDNGFSETTTGEPTRRCRTVVTVAARGRALQHCHHELQLY